MKMVSYLKKYSILLIGCFMLFLLLFFTFFGEYLSFVHSNPKEIQYIWNENNVPVAPPFAPSEDFLFGTDRMGRDILSLLIKGAKETLLLVLLVTLIRYAFAIPLAYFAHKRVLGAHSIVAWLNGTFAYIPTIIMIVLLATLPPILTINSRPLILMFILAIVELGRVSNIFKLEFDQLSTRDYIQAGISVGAPSGRLLTRYYLPFLYEKIIINVVTDLGKVMFLLGQLGFIGIFISQDLVQIDPGKFSLINNSITWPIYFMDAFRDIRAAVWIPFFPALAITYVILTFNVLGQGLQNIFKKNISHFNG